MDDSVAAAAAADLMSLPAVPVCEVRDGEPVQHNHNALCGIRCSLKKIPGVKPGQAEGESDRMVRIYELRPKGVGDELVSEYEICLYSNTGVSVSDRKSVV